MKSFALMFWIASAICQIQIEEISEHEKLLSLAFENVTKHLFQLETRMFINNYGVDSNTMTWLMLENLNKKGMPYSLQNLEMDKEKQYFDSSAFLTFNSIKKLQKFNKKLFLRNEFYKPLQFFVYCQGATIKDIKSLGNLKGYDFDLTNSIQYEYFLVDDAKSVRLMTFLWYSPGKCGELHLEEVSRFNKTTEKWANENFAYEKLKNFHNCEILVDYLEKDEFFSRIIFPEAIQSLPEHLTEIPKIPEVVISTLSSHLNYRTKLGNVVGEPIRFAISEGCYDVVDRKLSIFEELYDVIKFESYDDDEERKDDKINDTVSAKFITWPVQYLPQRLLAPPGGFYNEYEKLLMPFDFFTWALIASTFVASFSSILILYFVKRSIRDYIIGSNVSTPWLNVVQIFFGISQSVLPRRNFARYLTMLFILFCLIIRTAWQGKMYEFMQKNVTKPEIRTVEQMIERGYTFYMDKDFREKNPYSEITKRARVDNINDYLKEKGFVERIFDPNFKGVVQTDIAYEATIARATKGKLAERLRKKVVYTKMCGLVFEAHHHFVGIIDLKSQQLFTAGIIQHETETVMKDEIRKQRLKYFAIKGPKVLNMKILEPGFVIWSSSLIFIAIGFLFEWLITLKDYIVFTFILRALFRVHCVAGH